MEAPCKTLLPYFCLGTHTPCTRYAALILLSPRRRVASARRPCRPAKRAGAACFPSRPAGPSWCGAWAPAGSPPRPRCPPERRGVRRSALAPRDAVRGGSGRRPPRSRTRPSPRLGQNGAEQAPLHQRHSMPGGWHLGAASLGHSASVGPRDCWPAIKYRAWLFDRGCQHIEEHLRDARVLRVAEPGEG